LRKGWESRDCAAWRRLRGDIVATFQYLKGPTRKLEGDVLQRHGVIGQGVMALN